MKKQLCRWWLTFSVWSSMLNWFSHISTWLFIEMIATLVLVVLNLIIPMLMIFSSYRNIVNFYFSSVALASSLINTLYLFYLVQSLRSKVLLDINCRAIYYLQASCIVVLGKLVWRDNCCTKIGRDGWKEIKNSCALEKVRARQTYLLCLSDEEVCWIEAV